MSRAQRYSRGYDTARERAKQHAKLVCSCFNCDYYYQGRHDASEVCQNPSVLQYDMVVEENRIYCIQWQQTQKKRKTAQAKKAGVFRLSRKEDGLCQGQATRKGLEAKNE